MCVCARINAYRGSFRFGKHTPSTVCTLHRLLLSFQFSSCLHVRNALKRRFAFLSSCVMLARRACDITSYIYRYRTARIIRPNMVSTIYVILNIANLAEACPRWNFSDEFAIPASRRAEEIIPIFFFPRVSRYETYRLSFDRESTNLVSRSPREHRSLSLACDAIRESKVRP